VTRHPGTKPVGRLSIAILLTVSSLIGWYGATHPKHSWDTVPYVALILSLDGVRADDLHRQTYHALQDSLSDADYQHLVSGTPLRQEVSSNARAFEVLLPFFAAKPLYLWATYAIAKLGVEVVQATTVASTLSAVLLYVVVSVWMLRHFKNYAGLALALVIAFAGGLLYLLGLARPDGISALLMFSSVFLLTEYRATRLAAAGAALAILARPDNIVMSVLIGLYIAAATPGVSARQDRIAGALSVAASVLAYLTVQRITGAYGWETTFSFSFTPPASLALFPEDASVTLPTYLSVLYRTLRGSLATLAFWRFALFGAIAALAIYRSAHRHPLAGHMLIMLTVANIVHWLAFPDFMPRFFVASYLAIGCIVLILIKSTRSAAVPS
jgi:hypothetical protein